MTNNFQPHELISIRDWIRFGSSRFTEAGLYFGHGTDNAWDEAAFLVLWAIHQPWERLELILDAKLALCEREKISEVIERRINERIPAAYIAGEAWFAGYKFEVNNQVLVPRSPIAELIGNGFEPWLSQYPYQILDMCCGSGCIGLACAMFFDESEVLLVDISRDALGVANNNIERYQLNHRVKTLQSDGFEALTPLKYDLIVSNPPYVDVDDLRAMPAEYHAEPKLGLASGDDGLDFTRRILKEAAQFLNDNGVLIVEVGNSWQALESAFPNTSFVWPALSNGGHGVFVLRREQLVNI